MAAESIGNLIPTKIPGYADAADIQAALRVYHYGSYTYDVNETNAANLVNPSMAYTINNLQTQISSLSTDYVDKDLFTAKGSLVGSSAASTPVQITTGTNGQVLTVNTSTTSGLQWSTPEVTLTNTATLTNKKLSDSTTTIVDATDNTKAIKFDVAGTTGITGTIATAFTTAKTITLPDVTGTVALLSQVINNTLTSTTGDIIYASSSNTPARLGIGTEGQVLTVASGVPTWAASSGGGGSASLPDIFLLGGM